MRNFHNQHGNKEDIWTRYIVWLVIYNHTLQVQSQIYLMFIHFILVTGILGQIFSFLTVVQLSDMTKFLFKRQKSVLVVVYKRFRLHLNKLLPNRSCHFGLDGWKVLLGQTALILFTKPTRFSYIL